MISTVMNDSTYVKANVESHRHNNEVKLIL